MTHLQENTSTLVEEREKAPKALKLFLKQPSVQQHKQEAQKKAPQRRVTWTEDTVDNENANNLKSNLCCIYHDPNGSSSDTCTSDDEANALERDRETKKAHKLKCSKRPNKPKCSHDKGQTN